MTALNPGEYVGRVTHVGRGAAGFAGEVVRSRRLIFDLTRREFRGRYLGTAFGLVWAFIHPAVLTAIYWAVFKYAITGAGERNGIKFLAWLLSGLVPWFVCADLLGAGSSVVTDNRFLVKKVVFRVSLLPVVRLLSLLPVHLFFIAVIVGIDWGQGYPPTWYTLQVFYYLFALMLAGLGWTWLISALVPFLKDLGQVVAVLLQVLFFWTPLVWSIGPDTSPRIKTLAYLNPLTYIVEGYRESLVAHVAFWHHPLIGAYFWTLTVGLLLVGGTVFARLRSHFADVL